LPWMPLLVHPLLCPHHLHKYPLLLTADSYTSNIQGKTSARNMEWAVTSSMHFAWATTKKYILLLSSNALVE
jgi:hypothetical protein